MNVLGIDVGGSGIKGAPVNTTGGKLLADRVRFDTPRPATPAKVAKRIRKIARHFDWTGPIGCGFPAVVQDGVVRTASNIDKSWIGTDAQALFSQRTGCQTTVINDADAAGTAEMQFGAGCGHNGVVLVVTVGTGLGTALFTKGHLLPNTELGHLRLRHGKIAEHYASDATRQRKKLDWAQWSARFDEFLHRAEFLFSPDLIIIGGGASKKFSKFNKAISTRAQVVPAWLQNEAGIVGAAVSNTTSPSVSGDLEKSI